MGVFDKFSGIGVASGFKLQAKAPIDTRQVVDTIDDRNALITENGAYEGMQVYVKADKKTYLLKDLAAGTWEELGSGGGASELLTIEISVSITESTADVLKTYLNNNPDVLAKLEVASSFILKEKRQNIAVPETYVFEQNFKDTAFAAQHYFICVHAYGKDTTRSTILWFSVVSGAVKDITIRYHELRSGIPDYNQNDSTAASYIRNRPFYAETGEKMVQIVSGTYTGEEEGEMIYTEFPVTALLVADKPATIKTSQGVEETEVVKSIQTGNGLIPYIGNISLMEPEAPNTGETYFFYTEESNGQLVGLFIQTTHFTDMKIEVSQVQITETIVKMPSKYLPDEAATKSDVAVAIEEAITTTLNTDV